MKNLFSILALVAALLIVNSASAQTIQEIEEIELKLDRYSKQHTTANAMINIGAAVTTLGAYNYHHQMQAESQNYINQPPPFGIPLMIAGGLTSFIGTIISSTAHRKLRSKKYNNYTRFKK